MSRALQTPQVAHIRVLAALVFGLSTLGLVVSAPTTASTPTWHAPGDLSATGQDANRPKVAVDPEGNATAIWERFSGSNWIVQSAERPAGGAWSEPVDISVAAHDAKFPQVAVDSHGNATAVWEHDDGSNWIVQSAERPAGGAWSEPVDLSAAGQDAVVSKVTVDSQGNAIAVWRRFDGTNWIVQSAERPAGGAWSEPVDLSAAGQDAKFPELAVDPQGNATAVWERDSGSNKVIQSAERPAVGSWSESVDVSKPSQNAAAPRVTVDAQGNATAVWWRHDTGPFIIQSAERPAGGAWSEPVDLSAAGNNALGPRIAVDPQGNATAIWERFSGSNWIVQSAERPAGGAWSEPVDLSAAGQDAEWPNVTVDPQGNATAAWQRFDGSNWIVQSAERPAGGSWSASVNLTVAGQDAVIPQVVVDPVGNATAIWRRFNGSNWIVQSAERPVDSADASDSTRASLEIAPELATSPRIGRVFAPRVVRVIGGKALLRLRCHGSGRCRGVVKLIAAIRASRVTKRHRRRQAARPRKRILIGRARFSIPPRASRVIPVRLNHKGKALLRNTLRHRLNARLQGRGVHRRGVVLKEVRRRRRA